jgi:hypothetical protein
MKVRNWKRTFAVTQRPLMADICGYSTSAYGGRAIHFMSVCAAAMQTCGVGHYIPGIGMISMISIHAPGICR